MTEDVLREDRDELLEALESFPEWDVGADDPVEQCFKWIKAVMEWDDERRAAIGKAYGA